MVYFTKKEQLVIMFLILIIILISLFGFLKKNFLKASNNMEGSIELEGLVMEVEESEILEEGQIMVHISGEVYRPGLVELSLGSRVIDAVEIAGGLKKDADLDRINLAKKLVDEEKIYIPRIGEEDGNIEILVDSGSSNGKSDQININTGSKEELMSLPGIGEVLAGRIIEYREQTPFKTIEDIKNVSGIGDKKFEGIKDLIKTR